MGKQNNLKFIGTVNNLIYYKWKDIYAVRTKPSRVNQTKASIKQSKLFGMAAHTGAVLRTVLRPALPDAKDLAMMRRFEQATLKLRAAACGLLNDNSLLCTAKELPIVYNDLVLTAQKLNCRWLLKQVI